MVDKPSKKFFNSHEYYVRNKDRINKYNRIYWFSYYQINKLNLKISSINRVSEKRNVTIERNVTCTF